MINLMLLKFCKVDISFKLLIFTNKIDFEKKKIMLFQYHIVRKVGVEEHTQLWYFKIILTHICLSHIKSNLWKLKFSKVKTFFIEKRYGGRFWQVLAPPPHTHTPNQNMIKGKISFFKQVKYYITFTVCSRSLYNFLKMSLKLRKNQIADGFNI